MNDVYGISAQKSSDHELEREFSRGLQILMKMTERQLNVATLGAYKQRFKEVGFSAGIAGIKAFIDKNTGSNSFPTILELASLGGVTLTSTLTPHELPAYVAGTILLELTAYIQHNDAAEFQRAIGTLGTEIVLRIGGVNLDTLVKREFNGSIELADNLYRKLEKQAAILMKNPRYHDEIRRISARCSLSLDEGEHKKLSHS